MIVFAAALFVAAVFAYSAVGKFPLINNYNCRHGLLASIPIAIAAVACGRLIVRSNRIYRWVMLAIVLACMTIAWRNEICWEDRYIKYLAIIENLRGRDADLAPTVVIADNSRLGMPECLRDYEINWILKQALDNERHLGLTAAEADTTAAATLSRDLCRWDRYVYMFQNAPYIEPNEPWRFDQNVTRVDVQDAALPNDLAVAAEYTFSSAQRRRELINSLVKLEFHKQHLNALLSPSTK